MLRQTIGLGGVYMKIKPLDKYEEPKYLQLHTVEKKVRSAALTGKKAAFLCYTLDSVIGS